MTTTQIETAFRIRVHQKGTADPTDLTVDFTLTGLLQELPSFSGQEIHPTKGAARSSPATYRVVDEAEVLSGELGDSDGLPDLLGRVVELQENRDGGGYATTEIGRLVNLEDDVAGAGYLVTVSDERWKERNSTPWGAADTAQIWPAGMRGAWRGFLQIARRARGTSVDTSGANLTRVRLSAFWPLERVAIDWIQDDLLDDPEPSRTDAGNFNHLRLNLDGTDYEVVTFADLGEADLVGPLEDARADSVYTWIRAVGGLPAPANGSFYRGYLWAPTAPPSPELPLHLGVLDLSHRFGFRQPFRLLRALYDEAGVRYSQSHFDDLEADTFYGYVGERITDPDQDLSSWAEEKIYKRYGVIPFVNDLGEIAPRPVRLPDEDATGPHYVDATNAFEFNPDNCVERPRWDHSGRETVNVFQAKLRRYSLILSAFQGAQTPGSREDFKSLDGFEVREWTTDPVEDPSVADLGPQKEVYDLTGIPARLEIWLGRIVDGHSLVPAVEFWKDHLRRDVFARFGRGPIWLEWVAHRQTQDGSGRTPEDDVAGGDLVRVNVDTVPNPSTNSRGGARLAQIMEKIPEEEGIRFRALDIGPASTAGSTPGLTLGAVAGEPYNAVEATISGLDAGWEAEVELKFGAGGFFGQRTVKELTNGSQIVREIPSGTLISARARAMKDGRVKSDWSATATHTTSTIPAPTIDSSEVDAKTIRIEITPGDSAFQWMPLIRPTGGGSYEDDVDTPLRSDARVHVFLVEDLSTSYDVAAQHVDPYGGRGAISGTAETSGGSENTLTAPSNLQFAQERSLGGFEGNPGEILFGHGIDFVWTNGDPTARVRIQVATDSGFGAGTIVHESDREPGRTRLIVRLGQTNDTLYVRVRHEKDGFQDSAWSPTISGQTTSLVVPRPDPPTLPPSSADRTVENNQDLSWLIAQGAILAGNMHLDGDAEQIRFGSATDPTTGVGIFLGLFGGVYHARFGDPAGDLFHWDGVNLTITGALTATTLDADSGTIGGWVISATALSNGSVKLQSSAERILMGAATAPLTGVGIFAGKDGADYELRAGDPAGDLFHWDGTQVTIVGDLTATTLTATQGGSIAGWAIASGDLSSGNVTLSSALEQLLFGSATGPTSGVGIFIGLSGGVYELRAGDPAGESIHWDGTNLIVSGAVIDGTNIQNRSLQIRHRFLGSHDNLVANPGFEQDNTSPVHWRGVGNGGSWGVDTVDPRSGDVAASYDPTGQTATADLRSHHVDGGLADGFAVAQGDEIYQEVYVRKKGVGAANAARIYIWFGDRDGVFVSGVGSSYTAPTDSYTKISASATAPAGAAVCHVFLQVRNDGNAEAILFDDVLARRKVVGDFIVDGTLTASHVAADSLTADEIATLDMTGKTVTFDVGTIGGWVLASSHLQSGDITLDAGNTSIVVGTATAPHTGDGIFMGVVGASGYEFSARDGATGDEVHWDGSTLYVDGITLRSGATCEEAAGASTLWSFQDWIFRHKLNSVDGGDIVTDVGVVSTTGREGLQWDNIAGRAAGGPDPHYRFLGTVVVADYDGSPAFDIRAKAGDGLNLSSFGVGTDAVFNLLTNDRDGTDDVGLRIFGVGEPGATDFERFTVRWASGTGKYQVRVNVQGTGTSRPINFFTEGNSGQLELLTNGDVRIGVGSILMSIVGQQIDFEHDSDTGTNRAVWRVLKDASETWSMDHHYDSEALSFDTGGLDVLRLATNGEIHGGKANEEGGMNSVALSIYGDKITSKDDDSIQHILRLRQASDAGNSKGSTFEIGLSFFQNPGTNFPRTKVYFFTTDRGTDDRDASFEVLTMRDDGNVEIPNHLTTGSSTNARVESTTGSILRSTSSLRHKEVRASVTLQEARDFLFAFLEAGGRGPVWYRSRLPMDDPQRELLGVGAEDLHRIDTRFTEVDQKGRPIGVAYDRLPLPLYPVVGDHEVRIRELEPMAADHETRIQELELERDRLRARVDELEAAA